MRGSRRQFRRSVDVCAAGLAVLSAATVFLSGCASPGVPRPPSLHLPALVRDLSALRVGPAVELKFTVPGETTDHQPLMRKGVPMPLTAVVCRVQGAACLPVTRLSVAPGQTVSAVDTLPPPLTIGPGRGVAYRVRVENAAGRDAGLSRGAVAVAGAAPGAVVGLGATTVAEGVELTWRPLPADSAAVRVEAVPDAAAPQSGSAPSREGASARLLQVPLGHGDPGGAIDPAPAVGARVTYRVYRQHEVSVSGQLLQQRGPLASVTVVRAADVFAPAAPLGLLAVSFSAGNAGASVSLSWEPSPEPDVVGYRVYRAAGTGTLLLRTPKPVMGVSFQDTGLEAGSHLRYAVTAVDRNGNESGRSAIAEVEVR